MLFDEMLKPPKSGKSMEGGSVRQHREDVLRCWKDGTQQGKDLNECVGTTACLAESVRKLCFRTPLLHRHFCPGLGIVVWNEGNTSALPKWVVLCIGVS